jgi:hypothetical protein
VRSSIWRMLPGNGRWSRWPFRCGAWWLSSNGVWNRRTSRAVETLAAAKPPISSRCPNDGPPE